jgi:mxaA protein
MLLPNIFTNLSQLNMTKYIALFIFLIGSTANVYALDSQPFPDVKDGVVVLQIQDPDHKAGYTVGDVLTRHLVISIKKPYKLVPESLPIVGYEKKYKGQPLGIDLSDLEHTEKDESGQVIHNLSLSYQVFTNSVVAKPGALPTEYIRLINTESKGKEVVKFRIPSYEFVISPLSIFGQIKVEEDMSGFQGPLLLDASPEKKHLKILLSILVLSLLGLLYILGRHAWLPHMGGPFARTFRVIRKLPNDQTGLQTAVSKMHESLNATAGNSLFNSNLDAFLEQKPAFKVIKIELLQFFALSRQVFFEPNAKHEAGSEPIQWLTQLCRRCRDCERGLVPNKLIPDHKA